MYAHMTYDECMIRWPRLVWRMRWAAILSAGEAGCALRDYRDAREALAGRNPCKSDVSDADRPRWRAWGRGMMRYGGGEAVSHCGGPAAVLRNAIDARHAVPKE